MAKKQQIILLHGNHQLTANTNTTGGTILVNGEVAVFNAQDAKNVEIYATAANGDLATFVTKDAVADIVDAAVSGISETVGNEDGGLVKDVEDLKVALGLNGDDTSGTSVYVRVGQLEQAVGATGDTGTTTLWGSVNDIKNNEIPNAVATALSGLTVETNTATTKYVYGVSQENGVISAHTADLTASAVTLNVEEGEYSAVTNVQTFFDNYKGKMAILDSDIAAAKTLVSGETENANKDAYIEVVLREGENEENVYDVAVKNAASVSALTSLENVMYGWLGADSGNTGVTTIRQIAVDELTKQLIPEDAQEALDTLQEISAWIQSHPEDAAKINAVLGGYLDSGITGYTNVYEDVVEIEGRLDAIEANRLLDIVVDNTNDNKIIVEKRKVSEDSEQVDNTIVYFNFDNMVIDGGEY